jgi:hypothetical protein
VFIVEEKYKKATDEEKELERKKFEKRKERRVRNFY